MLTYHQIECDTTYRYTNKGKKKKKPCEIFIETYSEKNLLQNFYVFFLFKHIILYTSVNSQNDKKQVLNNSQVLFTVSIFIAIVKNHTENN